MKQLGFLLAIVSSLAIHAQSVELISKEGYKGLKVDGKETIIPVFDNLGWSDGQFSIESEVLGYQENEKWGLINFSGKRITAALYDKISVLGPDLFLVANKGKFTNRFFYGLINSRGKIQLNQDYFEITREGDAILVTILENQNFLMGALSKSLDLICEPTYDRISVLGSLVVATSRFGHIDLFDSDGKLLEEGLDAVRKDGDFLISTRKGFEGLISIKGEIVHRTIHKAIIGHDQVISFPTWEIREAGEVSETKADSLTYVSRKNWLRHLSSTVRFYPEREGNERQFRPIQLLNGFSIVKNVPDNEWQVFNPYRARVLSGGDSIVFDGSFIFQKHHDGWSVHTKEGKQLSDRRFEEVKSMNRQFVAVKKFGFFAILDGLNETISDFRYDQVRDIIGTKAIVRFVNKWGVYQPDKEWLIEPDYDSIALANDHFIARNRLGNYIFSLSGELLFQTIDEISPVDDYFITTYAGKSTAIGNRGRPISEVGFQEVRKLGDFFILKNEFAEVRSGSGRVMFGTKERIEDVVGYSEELFLVKKDGAYGFVDGEGRLRIANRYDSARCFSEGRAAIMLRGKWGFIDKDEELVIQPHYERVMDFTNGVTTFTEEGLHGFISKSGDELSKAIYREIKKTASGNFILKNEAGLYGLADQRAMIKLSPGYDVLKESGDYLVIGLNGKFALFSQDGLPLTRFEYSDINIQNGQLTFKKID